MTTAPTAARSRHINRWAFLPALVLLVWGGLAASGVSFTGDSQAANSSTIGVTVDGAVTLGGTCTTNGTMTGANFLPSAVGAQLLGACTVTQGTTNGSQSLVRVESTRATAGTGIFCQTPITVGASYTEVCAGAAALNFTQATAGSAALADGQFGIQATPGACSAGWGNTLFYPLRDATTAPGAGDIICQTLGSTATTTSTLSFQADPIATQGAGAYTTRAEFTVAAT
ncbi:hypothetical protein [Aeromicrobium sp.]|uniref:hypothetical protein n=1 Tax=Aeromicrobium sp. TaxID=1871063 RepID=UPI0019ADA04C|nr:hypothetical protein [Aeromicrobium sp.]MBC7632030.1 hypothetical protein [Aeromicrobium sp.]